MTAPPALVVHVTVHPLLELAAFTTRFSRPLAEVSSPPWLGALLAPTAALGPEHEVPVTREPSLVADVRDLLRHGGYKPTGRGKPASEYLVKAAALGLGSINLAVDACNVVSLHSGLPISVVDVDRLEPPLSVRLAEPAATTVFNASGQSIRLGGLLCLHDRSGPSANAVKDSQRTKTHDATRHTLSLVWGVRSRADHVARTTAWYRGLLERAGTVTSSVELVVAPPAGLEPGAT